jgi:replicative DNA helicase
VAALRSAAAVLADAETMRSDRFDDRLPDRLTPFPTGFEPLDSAIGGGLHAEDLVLVGGRPGAGKTVATLQWARRVAIAGRDAVYVCYEHGEDALITRLLSLELGEIAEPEDVPALDKLRQLMRELSLGARSLRDVVDAHPLAADAYEMFRTYADRLLLLRASTHTGLADIATLVGGRGSDTAVLFVDYLQKVPVDLPTLEESERVTRVAGGLKELALAHDIAVVAVVAADRDGLLARRLRLHHLRGSTALAHDADVVITLNEKWSAVSKTHLAYDATRARTYRQWVVFSIEKNRDGPALVDLEFRKDFANFRFESHGSFVAEHLVDDVLFEE